ncbi:hypothetical protein [Acetobacterium bakii]|uniref:AdoMet activation domain-containing protein n=1 Tax=Acetobacterium bakii TaxID=52689 RepID=A0A0L6U4Z9_9FIRM|nr:hypothetical protein [Acetobacterium bakii]KNZ43609.1 hypothetical protein AKG39_00150 [Acetobacterium bakii]
MVVFTQTEFIYDKDRIFRQLHLKENENATKYTHQVFPKLIKLAKENLKITTCYSIRKNITHLNLPNIDCCKYVVSCFCSCSNKINEVIEDLIQKNEFLDGFLLNHISNEILFNASNQMNTQLENTINYLGLRLTKRHSPGENNIDLQVQENILRNLKDETNLEVSLTENYMLEPEKSMLYYFGADSQIESHSTKHDCKTCDSINCPHRLVD